jgi:hypothetical protein
LWPREFFFATRNANFILIFILSAKIKAFRLGTFLKSESSETSEELGRVVERFLLPLFYLHLIAVTESERQNLVRLLLSYTTDAGSFERAEYATRSFG